MSADTLARTSHLLRSSHIKHNRVSNSISLEVVRVGLVVRIGRESTRPLLLCHYRRTQERDQTPRADSQWLRRASRRRSVRYSSSNCGTHPCSVTVSAYLRPEAHSFRRANYIPAPAFKWSWLSHFHLLLNFIKQIHSSDRCRALQAELQMEDLLSRTVSLG